MSLDSITEQVIAGLIVATVVAVVGLLVQRKRSKEEASDDVREAPHLSAFDKNAFRLLESIHDLAGGNPGQHVDTAKAAEKAAIAVQDVNPICRYLKKEEGYISRPYAGFGVVTITPAGIRAVKNERP